MATATLQTNAIFTCMLVGVIVITLAATDFLAPDTQFFIYVGWILMGLSNALLLIEVHAQSPKHPTTPIWR
jgi:hypothetical protein